MAKDGKSTSVKKPAKAAQANISQALPLAVRPLPAKPVIAAKPSPVKAAKKAVRAVRAEVTAEQLWRAHRQLPSDATRNALLEFYMPAVRFQADRLRKRLPDGVDVDDLIQAGFFGLEKAIKSFDPARGFKFETFASQRIHGEILDSLRAMDWVPRLVRSRTAKVDAAVRRHEMAFGIKPTEAELAHLLDIHDAEEFVRVRRDSVAAGVGSMDRKWSDGESGKETSDAEVLVDESQSSPLAEASRSDLKAQLMRGLTRSEKLIITLYYWEQMTMKEIGKVLDLSESRVSQMHASVLARLKGQLGPRAAELIGG